MKNIIWDLSQLTGCNTDTGKRIIEFDNKIEIEKNYYQFLSNLQSKAPNYCKIIDELASNAEAKTGSPYTIKFIPKFLDYFNLSKSLNNLVIQEITYIHNGPNIIKIIPKMTSNNSNKLNDKYDFEFISNPKQGLAFGANINIDNKIIYIEYLNNFNIDMMSKLIFELFNANNEKIHNFNFSAYIGIDSTEKDYHLYAYNLEKAEYSSSLQYSKIMYEYLLNNKDEIILFMKSSSFYQTELESAKSSLEIAFEDIVNIKSSEHYKYYVEQAREIHQNLINNEEIKKVDKFLEEKNTDTKALLNKVEELEEARDKEIKDVNKLLEQEKKDIEILENQLKELKKAMDEEMNTDEKIPQHNDSITNEETFASGQSDDSILWF